MAVFFIHKILAIVWDSYEEYMQLGSIGTYKSKGATDPPMKMH